MNDQIYKNWRKDVGTDYETTRKLVDDDYTRANISRNTENELVEMNEKLTGATEMNEKPEALRLADALDDLMGEETLIGAVHIDKASYELRRLHEENERLRKTAMLTLCTRSCTYEIKHAVKAEREACAKVCENIFQTTPLYAIAAEAAQDCAAAIRARNEQEQPR